MPSQVTGEDLVLVLELLRPVTVKNLGCPSHIVFTARENLTRLLDKGSFDPQNGRSFG